VVNRNSSSCAVSSSSARNALWPKPETMRH
jgi:hypothetical protein